MGAHDRRTRETPEKPGHSIGELSAIRSQNHIILPHRYSAAISCASIAGAFSATRQAAEYAHLVQRLLGRGTPSVTPYSPIGSCPELT